jgi:hypothetical protein
MNAISKPPIITEPGAYDGIAAADYHSIGCTIAPALSASGAKLIETECPALYFHRYISPGQPERKPEFDVGTAAHLMVLEPQEFDARVSIIDAGDYRGAKARDDRDAAYAAGLTPLLPKEVDAIRAMRSVLLSHPVARHAFQDGSIERSLFWIDPEFGVWRKTRPDFLPNSLRYMVDYKTSTSANPEKFKRSAADFGYHQQAAWYLDGVQAVYGERPKKFAFVVQDKNPPHLVSVCYLDDEAIEWGRILNRRAIQLFARCLETGEWPGYREDPTADGAFTIGLPGYTENALQKRLDAGAFADFAYQRAFDAQSP